MTNNKQSYSNAVTIVHILQNLNLTNQSTILELLENNAVFLSQHNVEYIILDQNNNDFLLKNISTLPSFQNKKTVYTKEAFINFKQSFLSGVNMTNSENIFFIQNSIPININNVYEIEKSAPLLQKKDLEFFIKNVPENFKWEKFKLYMKKSKNIFDKLKLLF